jgi:hypothetical protein
MPLASLVAPLITAIARAAAPAIGFVVGNFVIDPLSSAMSGVGVVVSRAVERRTQIQQARRAADWYRPADADEVLGTKPYVQSRLQKTKDTVIRRSLAVLIENLRLLTTTEDEMDEQYIAFCRKSSDTAKHAYEVLHDDDSDFVEELAHVMSDGTVMIRATDPNTRLPRTSDQKEFDREVLSVKVTDAIVKLSTLYHANCR